MLEPLATDKFDWLAEQEMSTLDTEGVLNDS